MIQIINSDCLEALCQMDSEIFDLCLLDPPYFPYSTQHRKEGREHKFGKPETAMAQQPRDEQIKVIQECIRVLKSDRAFYVFTNWENIWWMFQPFLSLWRNMIIWDKGNWSMGDLKGSFGNQYEVILLGVKGKWEYRGKRESDIWGIPGIGASPSRIHPTEKPVELYRRIIENSTDEGDFIIDPYMGSGASTIAAMKTGRNFIGYEIDKDYYDKIIRRIDEYKSK